MNAARPADAAPGARRAAEPARRGARRRRPRARLPPRARPRRRRGRRGAVGGLDDRESLLQAGGNGARPPAVPLRPPRHRAAERAARAGGRGRLGAKRRRDDPRRGQQGRGGRDARGGAAGAPGGSSARGDRADLHAEGGGRPARRGGVRRIQALGAGRVRLRPAGPGRRDRAGRPDAAVAGRQVPRARRARGDGARGRALGDRGGRDGRSPISGSAVSTRRPRPTSG